jgi:hypothetical protein
VRLKTFVAISILQSTSRAASAVLCPLGHLADVQNGSQPFYLDTLFCCWPYLRDKYGTALAVLKGKVHDALYKKSNWLEGNLVTTIMGTPRGMMARSVLLDLRGQVFDL